VLQLSTLLILRSPRSGRLEGRTMMLQYGRRWIGLCGVSLALLLLPHAAGAVEVKSVKSPGGIEAWLVEDHTVPVVSLEVAFLGGAATEPKEKAGLANMTASLLDEGAGELDSQAFARRIEDLASSLRFTASQDNLAASLRTITANIDPVFDLLRLAVTKPRFDAEPVARVRSQIVVSLARKAESPNTIAGRVWWRSAFPDHPYGRPSEGTPETVPTITVEDMRQFMRSRVAKDVMTIGVVGDIDAARLAVLLDATFGALPATAAPAPVADAMPVNAGLLLAKKPIPQSVVTFGQNGLKRDDPDWYTALVVNYVFGGGGFTSRLTTEVREKRGLAYSVYSYLAPLKHTGVLIGGVATENGRVAQSLDIIRAEWRRMRDEGPTADELDKAKTYLTGSFPLQFDSTGRIAGTLVDIQQNNLGIDYLEKRNAYIAAVTLDEARRVAKRLYDPDALSFAVVGAPVNLTPTREVNAEGNTD
jgi:zinc protease